MKIIIIGSGIAGVNFAEQYRKQSADAKITLLTKENHGFYSRPMLSRGFSRQNIEQSIILKPFAALQENNICVIQGVEVTQINRQDQYISAKGLDEIETLDYDKLVIATGSDAMIPPPFQAFQEHFFLLNSLQDLLQLRKFRQKFLDNQQHPHWAVIGGGLIGCEIASDLAVAGDKVCLFHAMDRLMERQLLSTDSEKLLAVLQNMGLDVRLNQAVKAIPGDGEKTWVETENSKDSFNGVIVCCGFKPRISLAKQAGLQTHRGIVVNQYLQTSDENIYALGDVAELPNGKLYAFIMPIRNQSQWLTNYLCDKTTQGWQAPPFNPAAKVHGFEADNPYIF